MQHTPCKLKLWLFRPVSPTYVDMVTVMAGNLVDHSSLLLLRYSVLHIDKGLSDSPVRFGDQLQVGCLDVPTDSIYLLCYYFDIGETQDLLLSVLFGCGMGWLSNVGEVLLQYRVKNSIRVGVGLEGLP